MRFSISDIDQLSKQYPVDSEFSTIWGKISTGGDVQGYWIVEDLLFIDHRICILVSDLRMRLIHELHCNNLSVHVGIDKTINLLEQRYYWSKLRKETRRFVKHCPNCQRTETGAPSQGGYIPLPIMIRPWQDISLDFITGLPQSQSGNDAICVVVDRFSHMAHFLAYFKTHSVPYIAELFIKEVVHLQSLSTSIVSDRDPKFVGQF